MPLGNEGEAEYEGSVDETLDSTLADIKAREAQPSAAPPPSAEPAAPPPQAAPAAPPPPWDNMPRSWKADYQQYWGAVDPKVREYIHQREREALNGITQYKQMADSWNKALGPYTNYIKQYNLNPAEVINQLTAAHILMKFGTLEQRQQVAHLLDKDYGLGQFFRQAPDASGNQAPQQRGPDLTPYERRIAQLEAQSNARAQSEADSEVEAFITNPNNKYAAQVAPAMLELLEQGRARDLNEAYKLACALDPSVFEQTIAARVQAATAAPPPPRNVRPSATPPRQAGRVRGSIEDTMRETLSQIQTR